MDAHALAGLVTSPACALIGTDANLQRHSSCHVQHTGIVQHIGSRVSTAFVVATLYSSWPFLPLSYRSMLDDEVALQCTCANNVSYLQ
jgi:hypothetical protein